MSYRLCTALLFSYSVSLTAAEITVYRWIDDKNIVHFSQHQPSHDNYTELTMVEAVKASKNIPNDESTNAQVAVNQVAQQENSLANNVNKPIIENISDKCAAAKLNLKTLAVFDKIQYTDDQGQMQVLTNEQKNQQQELSEKQVKVYCDE